jgi:hypothetical protein
LEEEFDNGLVGSGVVQLLQIDRSPHHFPAIGWWRIPHAAP